MDTGRIVRRFALRALASLIFSALMLSQGSSQARAQSGYQVINGTQVFTVVNQPGGYATFSNSCGTQVLTQLQLQRGAIPNQIIPCPRGGAAVPNIPLTPTGNAKLDVGLGLLVGVAKLIESSPVRAETPPTMAQPSTLDSPPGSIARQDALPAPRSRRGRELYEGAAALNRDENYCAAEQALRKAKMAFEQSGDAEWAAHAHLSAELTGADCRDALQREANSHVYYCVDEDNVYGRPWVPKRPGEGCGPGLKERVKKGENPSVDRAVGANPPADRAAGADQGSKSKPASRGYDPAPVSPKAVAEVDNAQPGIAAGTREQALENFLQSERNGYSNAGVLGPPDVAPADNILRALGGQ